ncbi:PaaI family thioesterase, partial [Nocardia tengchongensis]
MQNWEAPNPDYATLVPAVVLSMPAAKHLGFGVAPRTPRETHRHQPPPPAHTHHHGDRHGGGR